MKRAIEDAVHVPEAVRRVQAELDVERMEQISVLKKRFQSAATAYEQPMPWGKDIEFFIKDLSSRFLGCWRW